MLCIEMSGPRRYGTGFGAVEEEGLESLNAEIPTLKSEDAMEGIEEEGDDVLERLFALLSNSRVQLARAVEEANQLNISDEVGFEPISRQFIALIGLVYSLRLCIAGGKASTASRALQKRGDAR